MIQNSRTIILRLTIAALFMSTYVATVAAQTSQQQAAQDSLRREAERRLGRSVSNQEILDRIRASGMSRAQARTRLQQMGYDPSLADAYFDRIAAGDSMPGLASTAFVRALTEVGLMIPEVSDSVGGLPVGARVGGNPQQIDRTDPDRIFGRELFMRESTEFVPAITGPVDPGYQLGPGDELTLVLTGDVEAAHRLVVSRDGFIVIPDVGQIPVAGITLQQLEDRLYQRLGLVYSGVRRGAGATTQFQISLGRMRNIQVYITGDAEWPGAYQLSGASTVFHALYQAGGPTENGSFRHIQVRRGGEMIRTVDLYDYLLRGDSRNDIRLQHNDIVFIPPAPTQVKIQGAVRRPATYEMREQEGLRDLLAFAAGVQPGAILRNVQIDRVLPPDQRSPGIDRVLVNVDLEALLRSGAEQVPLQDGDLVQVSAVSDEVRNRISVVGSVRRPGLYEWRPGLTLAQLLDRTEGLDESALRGRAHIFRLDVTDGTRQIHRVALDDLAALENVTLSDRDSIVVYDRAALASADSVTIDGLVREPGRYALAEGMSITDVILAAGGVEPGAYVLSVEVARRRSSVSRGDSLSTVFRIPLTTGNGGTDPTGAPTSSVDLVRWAPAADEFQLRRDDHIVIRRMPGDEPLQPVRVTGEVQFPGTYVLQNRAESISGVVQRSGGLTGDAHVDGIQVWRQGSLMGIDVRRALENPNSRFNVSLQAGDSIHVPRYDPTVLVQGAVGFQTRVLYAPDRDVEYYINQAGGFADDADRDRLSVSYPNGERQTRTSTLFMTQDPDVRPGSRIFVPARPAGERVGFDWDRALTRTLTVMSALATLILTYQQIR